MSLDQTLDLPSMYVVGLIGLFVGGLASYVANLLLREEGFVQSPKLGFFCSHRDSIIDAIPFISLLLLQEKCPICKQRIKWQYLFVEIFTAIAFCALDWHLGLNFYSVGMMFFVAILITICITDFKAKIIPHEITYPAIVLGIIFSAMTKTDVLGALAGIGVSYVLFDFLAFYGLKVFLWFHQPSFAIGTAFMSSERTKLTDTTKGGKRFNWVSKDVPVTMRQTLKRDYSPTQLFSKGVPLEELEVIGGGDAVLSALISAWLGWRKLIMSLFLGFLVGTVLGAMYVLVELRKERLLKTITVPVLACIAGLSFFAACALFMLAVSLKESVFLMPYQYILPGAAIAGALLGVIIAGTKTSKPFPFGPALAIGAAIAIFRKD